MDNNDNKTLTEFMDMMERVQSILIKEGIINETPVMGDVCRVSNLLKNKISELGLKDLGTGKELSYTYIIVYIDYLYSMGNYEPYLKPHVTIEWLIDEAYNMYKHGYNLKMGIKD